MNVAIRAKICRTVMLGHVFQGKIKLTKFSNWNLDQGSRHQLVAERL